MSHRFGALGPRLHRAGWSIIPIKARSKKPIIDAWQKGFSIEQVEEYAANEYVDGSVGLIAQNFPCIDIDVLDQECSDAIERCAIEVLGPAPARYGAKPKRLLTYRTDEPFAKVKVYLKGPHGDRGADGKKFAIEFLGEGQQYVIYGVHPDGFDYTWPNNDGPADADVWELTTITRSGIDHFINALPKYLPDGWSLTVHSTAGTEKAGDVLALLKQPLEDWGIERVEAQVLPHLNTYDDHDEWIKVGMALHHQGEGDSAWLNLWDYWSSQSGKWEEGICEKRWRSFSEQRFKGKGAVTLATLIHEMHEARKVATAAVARSSMDDLRAEIEAVTEARQLETEVARKVALNANLTDTDRGEAAVLIRERLRKLGSPVPIADVRRWLVHRTGSGFPHVNGEGHPLCTLENFEILMQRLEVTVRYNVISKQIEILIPGASFTKDNRDNATIAYVLSECEKVRMPTKHIQQFLLKLADAHQYNPVMQWIQSAEWDGVSRLEDFYATVVSDNSIKKLLIRKWLVQLVAAAASPNGIAGQGVLTFVGGQNIGKTSWFQRLAPPELELVHTGHTLNLQSKDSILTAIRYWIVELGEVDATFRKSDLSALKSFITQHTDAIRRPYAMTECTYPRRTAFGASVNDEQFLADPTGNRRFWTIAVDAFMLDHGIDMQQLWAEVLELWEGGEHWFLDRKELEALNDHNETFRVVEPVEERLSITWAWPKDPHCPGTNWEWITATEALIRAGIKDPKRSDAITAGRVLKQLNGHQRRKSNGKLLLAVPSTGEVILS